MTWDPLLYRGAAWWYARYRHPYPQALFDLIAREIGLDGTGRLLDLGCGPGRMGIPLAPRFAEAVLVDPDPEMLAEAARAAAEARTANVRLVRGSDADLPGGLGTFRVVTMGQSFHWMDRERTARVLHAMVEPGGAVVLVGGRGGSAGEEEPPPADRAAAEVINRYLGPERRSGAGLWREPERRHEDILTEAGFGRPEDVEVPWDITWTVDSLVGHLYSTSYAARHLFGERVEEFEREARAAILAAEPSGSWFRPGRCYAVVCRRRPT